ncbi:MAG: DUF6518 family protein [Acidimicrobiales bacterium]
MLHRRSATFSLVLAGALGFGAAMSVIHGSQGGVRAMIGNLSAPWLLIAFGAGAALGKRGVWRGAGAGLLVTVLALCAFYMANIYVLGLTGHGPLGDLRFALESGAYYIRLGLLTGPAMGVLGALSRRRRSMGIALAATGLLVFEPLAWFAYFHGHLSSTTYDFPAVAIVEMAVGVVLSAGLVLSQRRSASA